MAKTMRLDKDEQFRAVILYKYPGLSYPLPRNAGPTYRTSQLPELKTYYAASGVDYDYHQVEVAGPFSTSGQARAQITRAKKWHERGYGANDHIEAFVEVAETIWKKIY